MPFKFFSVVFLVAISFHVSDAQDDPGHPYTQGLRARAWFYEAFDQLDRMMRSETTINLKDAVYAVENAYLGGTLDYDTFNLSVKYYTAISKDFATYSELNYEGRDKENIQKLGAIFMVMTTTEPYLLDSGYYLKPDPFTYDFDDFWGEQDWTKMFVSKLLYTHTGNCHSLPLLYKIIADEMKAKCYLSLAPNHIYVKARAENPKIGWYNTELTNATFPIDGWIKSSGYVHLDAIKNSLYMDTLSQKQEIALCMIDLAKGYERLFDTPEDQVFISRCADAALAHYPNYANALLLKAENTKQQFETKMQELGTLYPQKALEDPEAKALFDTMEKLYFQLFQRGYRTMPKEMYIEWLTDLKENKEKYLNRDLVNSLR